MECVIWPNGFLLRLDSLVKLADILYCGGPIYTASRTMKAIDAAKTFFPITVELGKHVGH